MQRMRVGGKDARTVTVCVCVCARVCVRVGVCVLRVWAVWAHLQDH